jgi:hypothetical protein
VSKTPNEADFLVRTLEESYQELLALRLLVRRVERAKARAIDVAAKTKKTHSRQKQLADKRAR